MNASVHANQRFTRDRRCPICAGAPGDARGDGERCHGYVSSDGKYAHCSREERAGTLVAEDGGTYAHRLTGPCRCGETHGESDDTWKIVATYDYRDQHGAVLFQVVRTATKMFWQRRPDGRGGWIKGLGDTARVLYRLPELIAADTGALVYIAEGEKDVDALRSRGLVATCNPMGAGKWKHVDASALAGRHIVIIPDDDKPGHDHAADVATRLTGVAASVRTCRLPAKDASDWFAAGHTAAELAEIVASGLDDEKPAATPADPWSDALATALADVKAKLDADATTKREPLFLDAAELLTREFAETPWQVTGLITRGGTAVIGGEPKTTKTWLATEIAVAVATGTKVCGEFFTERGRVAYFYAEDLDKQVRNRDRALLIGRGAVLPVGQLLVQPRGVFLDVLRDDDLAWIVASCRRFGAFDLLVLDPLRDISSAEEDKSDSMRDVMRRLRVLGTVLACTVLVVHHTAKASESTSKRRPGQRLRGSGAIHGSIDSGIYLSDTGGDGVSSFVNVLDSEVKGARSAGRRLLQLDVVDNEHGEATCARWTVTRPDEISAGAENERKAKQDAADQDAVVARVRELAEAGEEPLSKTALRDAVPAVPDRRARLAIARELGKRLTIRDVASVDGEVLRDRVVML